MARCQTSPSFPPASIEWTAEVGGEEVRLEAGTEVRPAVSGGFSSVSQVRLRPGPGPTVRLRCSARYKQLSLSQHRLVTVTSKFLKFTNSHRKPEKYF